LRYRRNRRFSFSGENVFKQRGDRFASRKLVKNNPEPIWL
jgi:hypothetical protein